MDVVETDPLIEAMDTQESEYDTDENDLKCDKFRAEATFSVEIKEISTLKSTFLSPPTYVRMLPWKIMVLPIERAMGFFLQCNGGNDSTAWSCNAEAELRLKSFKPNTPPFTRSKIKHLFYNKENDYGYSNFITWTDLQDPEKCYIQNDTIVLEVHVIADAPNGVHTGGYVGLKSQGETCFLNSLLQTLYFTNQLRAAVYKIPTEADDSTKSVGLSLQRVFHDLQFGDKSVGTKKLTKSFGWETLNSFILQKHRVQEFLRVLLDKLESKMKGTCLEGTIPSLFEGKMTSYIKCTNINYNITRNETFYDIQLNIKDKKNIYDSFQDYIASETLEGDNKYDAGVHGLQEARKGVIFTSFPPVLHLHLNRFQYDPITDSSIKYNDRFKFFKKINLDRYLAEKQQTPAIYELHAVLVHSGDNHGGHYVVFINPKADGKWFKFDDDVTSCRKTEAIDQNYGGMDAKCSNAYMLVYIRSSELPKVLADIPENEIPSELVKRLTVEKRIDAKRCKERADSNLYVTVQVILEEHFKSQQKRKLFDLEKVHPRIFKLKQSQTIHEMVEMFVMTFGLSRDRMRIWSLAPSHLQKFTYIDFNRESHRTIDYVAGSQKPWNIFLELASPDSPDPLLPFNPKQQVLIFYKYYDATNKRLNYIGCSQEDLRRRLIDIIPGINSHLGFEPGTELTVYDESSQKKIINLEDSLEDVLQISQDNLQEYILIFEKEHVGMKLELPTVDDYFKDLLYRIEITFCDKCNPNDPEFVLELSNRNTYDQMAQAVAERLNTDPNKLQFFMCTHSYKDTPGNPIPYTHEGMIKDLIMYSKVAPKKIFYQRLSLSIHELDNKRQFKCIWVSNDLREEKELVLYPNKNETVKSLLDEAAKKIQFTENSRKKLRLMKVVSHKIMCVYKEDVPLESLQKVNETVSNQNNQKTFRIEEIPFEDTQIAENEMLIPVSHFSKEIYNSFGVPFLVKAKHNETFGAFKQRIQKRLNVPDKEWESYKFVLNSNASVTDVIDNAPIDLDVFRAIGATQATVIGATSLPFFGLDHINKSDNRPQASTNNRNVSGPGTDSGGIQARSSSPPYLPCCTTFRDQGVRQRQNNLSGCIRKRVTPKCKEMIDSKLLRLFTGTYQPISIVEEPAFRQFVAALNPSYELPNRHTISRTLIPALYEQCVSETRDAVRNARKVCISTDCWTSINMDSYMAVTVHFQNENFQLISLLLECVSLPVHYTAIDLAKELDRVLSEWELKNKVLLVVSDNTVNFEAALSNELKLKYFECFAHTINLVVSDGLKEEEVMRTVNKVKDIVGHFQRSCAATAKLVAFQKSQGKSNPLKLLQDVSTRWDSIYYMLARFVELEDAVKSTMALTDMDAARYLLVEEWTVIRELCQILEPFLSVTQDIFPEQYLTASLVILVSNGLEDVYKGYLSKPYTQCVKNVVQKLNASMFERFHGLENNENLSLTTLLDPRFKLIGFVDKSKAEYAKQRLISLVADKFTVQEAQNNDNDSISTVSDAENAGGNSYKGLWSWFDKIVDQIHPLGTASKAVMEVQRFIDCDWLPRTEDPLKWWNENKFMFPMLSLVAQEHLSAIATSVPCERMFSKAGLIISERRSRLSTAKTKMLLFLNSNLRK